MQFVRVLRGSVSLVGVPCFRMLQINTPSLCLFYWLEFKGVEGKRYRVVGRCVDERQRGGSGSQEVPLI